MAGPPAPTRSVGIRNAVFEEGPATTDLKQAALLTQGITNERGTGVSSCTPSDQHVLVYPRRFVQRLGVLVSARVHRPRASEQRDADAAGKQLTSRK